MQFRSLILATASTLAIIPAISQAVPETDALNACSRAFAASIAAPGAAAPAFKVSYHGTSSSAIADYYARGFTFYLNAFDPKTKSAMARATCTTDSKGVVLALSAEPIDKLTPTLTAQR